MNNNFTNNLEKTMDFFHKKGGFLTAGYEDKINTMTISWGDVGFMWNKPIFTVMVRPSRYTFELIEKGENFTVSIPLGEEMKEALKICGTKSGRDIDKCKEANIQYETSKHIDVPVVKGCNMYYECKILYKHEIKENEIPESIKNSSYKSGDLHVIYYGEILNCYEI